MRPLLGWNKPYDLSQVRLPCFASFKLDGWRAWPLGNEFMSRSSKTVANREVQKRFKDVFQNIQGWDGELIAGDPATPDCFTRTDKILKAHYADASDVRFFVFDNFSIEEAPFWKRLEAIHDIMPLVIKLEQVECRTVDDILELEAKALARNYEGLCLRSPMGKYKNGRSTLNEQYFLKLKRFLDGEATVTGFIELEQNTNEARSNELGYSSRSSHREGMVPMGTLGSLEVEMGGVRFRVGTGFTEADRKEIWANRDKYLGKSITVKYSPTTKDKPRQPRFKGFRSDL